MLVMGGDRTKQRLTYVLVSECNNTNTNSCNILKVSKNIYILFIPQKILKIYFTKKMKLHKK